MRNLIIHLMMFFPLFLSAFELPAIDLEENDKPYIVKFNVENIIKDNRSYHVISWETENATDVQLSFIGKADLSGSITITDSEYKRGPITLTASSDTSSFSDSASLNENSNAEKRAPVIIKDESKQQHYETTPQMYRPYRRTPYRRAPYRRY